jgi:D-alanyl-D-alanine carboxypeptidase (penicillin-binding protein 5/6)
MLRRLLLQFVGEALYYRSVVSREHGGWRMSAENRRLGCRAFAVGLIVVGPAWMATALVSAIGGERQAIAFRDGEPAEAGTTSAKELPPLQPLDGLTGLPFVSCRNWAVAEARSGKVIAESGVDAVVDVASTTKIMTAYVILEVVQKEPALLDQPVIFSERADGISGSSCGLKPGESLPVREMLYALLLPSGNDAAVALAEHFGRQFERASSKSKDDPLSRFVAEMNRTAKRLDMSATRYVNPNGLPEKGHVSSARDLVKLTVAARQSDLFREIVSTRHHDVEVAGRDGKRRTLSWKNTNRLLAIAGYSGVKTGFTQGAGSCLVSTGERGRDALIVVILGAPSADAAVADSRNLYRWAWRERGHRE